MTGIAPVTNHGVPQLLTGSPVAWGRDLGWIGATTGATAPAVVLGPAEWPFLVGASVAGLVCGLLLGTYMPWFLESARRRLSLAAIGMRCVAVGGSIGALIGMVAAYGAGELFLGPFVLAGIAGAVQLGWMWLPYTVLTVLQRPTWPVVLVATAIAPALGPLSVAIAQLLVQLIL